LRGRAGRFAVRAGFGSATAFAAGLFAGNGLETGPAGVPGGGFLCGSHGLLAADCGVFVESWWRFAGGKVRDFSGVVNGWGLLQWRGRRGGCAG
jgi:hypothetical protein